MAKINVLEKQVAELIAAGEVVERPASIVKELVENAVDAGATAVTVEIKGGGIRYIRVTDNGGGIEREDARNAFLRHATSKVRVSEDLAHITTMGFRGEALASIAAMCRVEVLTRCPGDTVGTRYVIYGGEEQALEDAGCPSGTTITVRDVFYNTPARMKFLKKDVSEGASVQAVVEKAALSEPGVAFRFIRDGGTRMQSPGDGKILSTVRCVLGKEFAAGSLPVSYQYEGMSVNGLIGKPEIARGTRSMQNFFINRRFVRSRTCLAALEEAFKGALMTGKFPSCVLDLTISPQTVDVNVHPAKTEVRFADEKSIFHLVYYGCRTALGAGNLTPEIRASDHRPNPFAAQISPIPPVQERMSAAQYRALGETAGPYTAPPVGNSAVGVVPRVEYDYQPACVSESGNGFRGLTGGRRVNIDIETDAEKPLTLRSFSSFAYEPKPSVSAASEPQGGYQGRTPSPKPSEAPVPQTIPISARAPDSIPEPVCTPSRPDIYEDARLVGELFDTYLLLQTEKELLFVDKHAAHERLLFNQLMKEGPGEDRQLLLTPVTVHLSQEEYAVVLEHLELFAQAGLGVEDFGEGYVVVREVAAVLSGVDLSAVVMEFAEKLLRADDRLISSQLENLFHTMACRAAVKARDRTETVSLEQLIMLLRQDGDAAHCPHGRPVAVRMSKYELEKKFGRLG